MSQELLAVFAAEGRELLEQAGQDLLALERTPDDVGALVSLFRVVHTLKGSAGLVGFAPMEALFHCAEDRLAEVRRGDLVLDRPLAEALLSALWQAERWIDHAGAAGELPPDAEAEARPLAARLAAAAPDAATPAPAPAVGGDTAWAVALLQDGPGPGPFVAFRYLPAADSYFSGEDPVAVVRAAPELVRLRVGLREAVELEAYDPFACNLILTGLSTAAPAALREAFRLIADRIELVELAAGQGEAPEPPARIGAAIRTLRVEGARIDRLGEAVDELVVAKNALIHLTALASHDAEPELARALAAAQADLNRQVGRLHDSVTRLRLTPLAPLFRRFPGLVRQTAAGLGKEADLLLSGEDVEVDKSVADGLFEPLLHLVRNALDHGIEAPRARRAAGKPVPAALRLSAVAVGEEVVIELADDGRGLDLDRIRQVALARRVADETSLSAMTDAETSQLIFAPGFSTAAEVTGLSGRGVGLDAVRTAVAALGGSVQVHSTPGSGARFTLALPLRVRLARLMVVESAGEPFGVPLEAIVETIRISREAVTPVRAGRALVWRDQPVPLLELSDLMRLPPAARTEAELKLIIVQTGEELAAVAVDRFGQRLEAPIRSMAGLLARVPGLAGTTQLGDGRVLMVLDLAELIA